MIVAVLLSIAAVNIVILYYLKFCITSIDISSHTNVSIESQLNIKDNTDIETSPPHYDNYH